MEAASLPTTVTAPDDAPAPCHAALYSAPMDAEQLSRKLQSYESIASSQMRNIEATLEQMLHQATGAIRRDMAARDERLSRRMDTEKGEQQTAILELRRDLTAQQSTDLATYEERLSKRLDNERREQRAAMSELRSDVNVQQDLRVQVASLRRDLGTTQAALSKLAQARGNSLGELSLISSEGMQSTAASEYSSLTAVDSTIADLRREVSDMRGALKTASAAGGCDGGSEFMSLRMTLQELSSRVDGASQNIVSLGKDLAEFQDRSIATDQGTQQQMSRMSEELAEVSSRSTALAGDDQFGLRRMSASACSGLSSPDSSTWLSPAQMREISMNVIRQVEIAERKLIEDLLNRMLEVEVAAQRSAVGLKSNIDEVWSSMARLGEDIQRERKERCTTLADVSCRADDAADMAKKAAEELAKVVSSPRRSASEFAGSSEMDSISERAANRDAVKGVVPDQSPVNGGAVEVSKMFAVGTEEYAALTATLGELDAEMRVEMLESFKRLSKELRSDLKEQVLALEGQFNAGAIGNTVLKALQERLQVLEDSRLDLRIGALESAAHHGAVFSVAAVQDAAEQALAKVAQAERDLDVSLPAIVVTPPPAPAAPPAPVLPPATRSPPLATRYQFFHEVTADKLQEGAARVQERVEALATTACTSNINSELLEEVRQVNDALSNLSSRCGGSAPESVDNADSGPSPDPDKFLSEELKGRLDVLVQQVKATLRDNPADLPLPDGGHAAHEMPPSYDRVKIINVLPQSGNSSFTPPETGVRSMEEPHSVGSSFVARSAGQQAPLVVAGSVTPGVAMAITPPAVNMGPMTGASLGTSVHMSLPAASDAASMSTRAAPMQMSATTLGDPLLRSASVVPVQPVVAVQSGPPTLKSVRVSEVQRRPMSPARATSPLRQRECGSPLRAAHRGVHGAVSPGPLVRDVSPTRLAQMPPLQVTGSAAFAPAPLMSAVSPGWATPSPQQSPVKPPAQDTPQTTAQTAYPSSWYSARR